MAGRSRGTKSGRIVDRLVSFFSGEWILNWSPYTANGGTVVAARTAWMTAWVYLPAFVLKTTLSEGRIPVLDFRQGLADVVETLPWLAGIFAGFYVGFYTRFSSQWTYLAGLYNQIVQAQLMMPLDEKDTRFKTLAAWKAGFIEDAEDLHLAAKPMFLVAVRQWGTDPLVSELYAKNTIGGATRLTKLLERLNMIGALDSHSDSDTLMSSAVRIAFYGAAAILAFDVIASAASRTFDFPYRDAAVGSWLIYATVAFAVGQRASIPKAMTATMFVGLVEATAGWWLSWIIGPGRWSASTVTPARIAFILAFVLVIAGIIGGVAGTIGHARTATESVSP